MKKQITYLTAVAILIGGFANAQIYNKNSQIIVEPGATLVVKKGGIQNVEGGKVNNQGTIELQDGDWLNDSLSIYFGGGDLKFSGSTGDQKMEHYMFATGNDTIGSLIIDKAQGDLMLRSDVLLTKDLTLMSGNLWLFDTAAAPGFGGNIELYGTTQYAPGTMVVTTSADGSRQHYLAWKNVQPGGEYEVMLAYVNAQGELISRPVKVTTETVGCCVQVAILPGVWEDPETKQNYVLDDVATSTLKLYSLSGGEVDIDLGYNIGYETGTDFANGTEAVSGLYWKEGSSSSYEEMTTTEVNGRYVVEGVNLAADTVQYIVLADEDSDLIEGLILSMTAWLQGPYSAGNMSTALRQNELIPAAANDPAVYGAGPWNYDGPEGVASVQDLPADAVDWVLIELRDAASAADATASTTVKTVAGLIMNDGRIVGTNGNPLSIKGLNIQNNLYVVLRHRNHLDVMSAGNLTTNANGEFEWDFTGANSAYGSNALADLGNGEYGMIAGDVNGDGQIVYDGGSSDRVVMLLDVGTSTTTTPYNGYNGSDINLDGQTIYDGGNSDRVRVLLNVGTSTTTTPISNSFPQ